MAYQKSYKRVNWQNLPSKETAISAENLNSMDSQIDKNETDIIALKEKADEHDSTLNSHKKALENDAFNIKNNTANIKTNADNIAQNTADIANNTTAIQTNATNIANNTKSIQANTANIKTNTTNIATNTANIAKNATAIQTNTNTIAGHTKSIQTNATNIAKNTTAIQSNADHIDSISETIAQVYTTDTEYFEGDYCTFNYELYVCTGATSGEFNPNKWTKIKVGDIIGSGGGTFVVQTKEFTNATGTRFSMEVSGVPQNVSVAINGLWLAPSEYTRTQEGANLIVELTKELKIASTLVIRANVSADEIEIERLSDRVPTGAVVYYEGTDVPKGYREVNEPDYLTNIKTDLSKKLDSTTASQTYATKTDMNKKLDSTTASTTYMTKIAFNNAITQKVWWSINNDTITSINDGTVDGITIFSTHPSNMPKECTSLDFNKVSQYATMIYFKSPNYKVGLYIDAFANCAIWSGEKKVWKYITETS